MISPPPLTEQPQPPSTLKVQEPALDQACNAKVLKAESRKPKRYLLSGSKYCRDCGRPAVTKWFTQFCTNPDRKEVCKKLSAEDRNYCERCGAASPGPECCPHCLGLPLDTPKLSILGMPIFLWVPVAGLLFYLMGVLRPILLNWDHEYLVDTMLAQYFVASLAGFGGAYWLCRMTFRAKAESAKCSQQGTNLRKP